MIGRALAVFAVALPLMGQGTALAVDVVVEVTMVKAKARGPSDPSLRQWRSALRRVAGYRAYRVLDRRVRECDWARRQEFRLPGGRTLYLTPKGVRDGRVQMHVRLLDGTSLVVESDVHLQHDTPVFLGIDRGEDTGDGALVIMLNAEVQ